MAIRAAAAARAPTKTAPTIVVAGRLLRLSLGALSPWALSLWGQSAGARGRLRGGRPEIDDREIAVGGDVVAPAVARVIAGREIADHPELGRGVGPGDGADHMVAFGVGVLIDLVGDLQGKQGQPDAAVIGAGRQPVDGHSAGQQPAGRAAPETDVVPLAWGAVDFLLIGKILLAAEQEQGTDRGLKIAAAQEGGGDDPPAAGQRHVIGQCPACRLHHPVHLGFGSKQGHVHGIAEQPVAGAGPADEVVRNVEPGQDPVEAGEHQIGEQGPEDEEEPDLCPAPLEAQLHQQRGQPHRRDAAHHEEHGIQHGVWHRVRGGCDLNRCLGHGRHITRTSGGWPER